MRAEALPGVPEPHVACFSIRGVLSPSFHRPAGLSGTKKEQRQLPLKSWKMLQFTVLNSEPRRTGPSVTRTWQWQNVWTGSRGSTGSQTRVCDGATAQAEQEQAPVPGAEGRRVPTHGAAAATGGAPFPQSFPFFCRLDAAWWLFSCDQKPFPVPG